MSTHYRCSKSLRLLQSPTSSLLLHPSPVVRPTSPSLFLPSSLAVSSWFSLPNAFSPALHSHSLIQLVCTWSCKPPFLPLLHSRSPIGDTSLNQEYQIVSTFRTSTRSATATTSARPNTATCTLDNCDVMISNYGYQPYKATNLFFLVLICICFLNLIVHIFFSQRFLSWIIAMTIGVLMELVGYVCRVQGAVNPFNKVSYVLVKPEPFRTQPTAT